MGRPTATHPALLVLGETTYRRAHHRFGLLERDRLRHLYVIGKTGVGKSGLLANLIDQDLRAGAGVCVIDPHGPLAALALSRVPPARRHEVLVFDPGDAQHPTPINVFREGRRPATNTALLTSELLSVFRKQWASSWGPRLEYVLRNAILGVAAHPEATLLLLYRFLTSEDVRARVLRFSHDPLVRAFWEAEFPTYSAAFRAEVLSPVLNKIGAFLSNPTVRNLVGTPRTRIDIAELIDRGGVILANLSTGTVGEDAAHLLGGLLLSSIQLAAMRRGPAARPFYVYVDEFQNFVTDSLGTLLSESRKFGLGLTLAHQYLAQLPDALSAAILGNVGSLVAFSLGADDAERLAPEFHPVYTASDLLQLGPYEIAVRLLVGGRVLTPFSARTLPPPQSPAAGESTTGVTRASRERFARPRALVEAGIARAFGASTPSP